MQNDEARHHVAAGFRYRGKTQPWNSCVPRSGQRALLLGSGPVDRLCPTPSPGPRQRQTEPTHSRGGLAARCLWWPVTSLLRAPRSVLVSPVMARCGDPDRQDGYSATTKGVSHCQPCCHSHMGGQLLLVIAICASSTMTTDPWITRQHHTADRRVGLDLPSLPCPYHAHSPQPDVGRSA